MTDEDTSQAAPIPEPAVVPAEAPAEVSPTPELVTEQQTAQVPESEPLAPAPQPTASPPTPSPATGVLHAARDLLVKARATIQFRKTVKLEKIMTELNKKTKITNDEIEKLLHVSDATATRYLSALERQGKIKQVGKTGTGVVYFRI